MNERLNITIGTAGHVDHGKTSLVKNLTGCDTDFLKEEKERGMSIDLGYAPFSFRQYEVGIVDVPGHESFIRTMVAGVTGIDCVLFVVAADDGVMPQTREHLDILSLLGVRNGLIVMSKIDRVSPDRRAEAEHQIRCQVHGTFLENSPIIPISNITGEGLFSLGEHLGQILPNIPRRDTGGPFRLPVDRAFAIKGFGTVVTGIPASGSAGIGDEIEWISQVNSSPERGRIRTVQVYQKSSERAQAGECAAINVPQWKHDKIARGDVVTTPGFFAPHLWLLCRLRVLPENGHALRNGEKIRFHAGTADVTGSLYLMEDRQLVGGEETVVQIRLDAPMVLGPRDHFIIRLQSPPRTVGGGQVLEGLERRLKRTSSQSLTYASEKSEALNNPAQSIELCLRRKGMSGATVEELAQETSLLPAEAAKYLAELKSAGTAIESGRSLFLHQDALMEGSDLLLKTLRSYHESEPQSPGAPRMKLAELCHVPPHCFEAALAHLLAKGEVVVSEGTQRVTVAGWQPVLPPDIAAACEKIEAHFREHLFDPSTPAEVALKAGMDNRICAKAIKFLKETGRLAEVANGFFFHAEAVKKAAELAAAHITKEGRLESVDFKYLLNTSRKYALPLLDHLDAIGLTRRAGNTRFLNANHPLIK